MQKEQRERSGTTVSGNVKNNARGVWKNKLNSKN